MLKFKNVYFFYFYFLKLNSTVWEHSANWKPLNILWGGSDFWNMFFTFCDAAMRRKFNLARASRRALRAADFYRDTTLSLSPLIRLATTTRPTWLAGLVDGATPVGDRNKMTPPPPTTHFVCFISWPKLPTVTPVMSNFHPIEVEWSKSGSRSFGSLEWSRDLMMAERPFVSRWLLGPKDRQTAHRATHLRCIITAGG